MSFHGPIVAQARPISALRKRLRARVRSLLGKSPPARQPGPQGTQRRRVYVGTHHKSGTVWLRRIFHQIAKQEGFWMNYTPALRAQSRQSMMIRFSGRSIIPPGMRDDPNVRMVHLIRDPRDMLISATHYHLEATEPWLVEPVEAFGGLTYRERLSREPGMESRLRFEMEHHHTEVLGDMTAWPWGRENVHEARYESLIADREMREFRAIFAHLGFEADETERALRVVWQSSLFGALDARKVRPHATAHIRSGRTGQWREVFTPDLARTYAERHGDVLARLGYAADDAWVDECTGGAAS